MKSQVTFISKVDKIQTLLDYANLLHNTQRVFWDIWLFLLYFPCWFFEIIFFAEFSLAGPSETAKGGLTAAPRGPMAWPPTFLAS